MYPSVDGRPSILAVLPLSLVVFIALRRFTKNRRNKLCFPPGPVPLPLVGNVLSIDSKEPWLSYTELGAAYGDLIFVRLLGQEVVSINSQHIAEALLDKRSEIYSDRPYIATAEQFGWSAITFAFTGYGDEWRLSRRLFHQAFRANSALKVRPMQISRAREMIVNLIDDPKHYHSHFATFSSSVGMSVIYDYQPSTRDDPLVRILEDTVAVGLEMTTPERTILLQLFPFLLKLPDWCWGSSIKRAAQISTSCMEKMRDLPFQSMEQHTAGSSFLGQSSMVTESLQQMEKQDEAYKPMFEVALKRAAAAGVMQSYETTTSTLMVFVLAMVLHPEVQRRAQAEIDSVIGRDRLPVFEDRTSLPYVESILRETFRWHPILPLGVPHATSSDDTYNGYFIPKGTTVMCNIWAISRDEKRYPNASHFIPERFLDVNGALTDDDPAGYVFGLGRRACPGRYAGDASVWSAIATMLATVDFSFAKDDNGKVIDFTPQFNPGLVRSLMNFPCNITLRSHVTPGLEDFI
ncbi:cytochrome P450 [Suillus bovinus]|uniref:cytochrome P450 n=1 Tax=Suillus bovinus TaxID=48563 RepID=UPI001B880496|nr:cytochrome P450 [Suillus bovinus]KAG2126244.1 cytochrome P450 [Suillus bovinus]